MSALGPLGCWAVIAGLRRSHLWRGGAAGEPRGKSRCGRFVAKYARPIALGDPPACGRCVALGAFPTEAA